MKWLLILWLESTGAPQGDLHPIYYSAYGTMETKAQCHQTGEQLLKTGWGEAHSGVKPYSVRAYMCAQGNFTPHEWEH
jgi:hypothetical protein